MSDMNINYDLVPVGYENTKLPEYKVYEYEKKAKLIKMAGELLEACERESVFVTLDSKRHPVIYSWQDTPENYLDFELTEY